MFELTNRQKLAAVVLLVLLLSGGALLFFGSPGKNAVEIGVALNDACYVHLCGAVAQPGVIKVKAGTRVYEALPKVGGALSEADLSRVNLAAFIEDGSQIYIPKRGETAPVVVSGGYSGVAKTRRGGTAKSASKPSGPLDLNTASANQLETIPGIGPALAAKIIGYRKDRGKFQNYEELLKVKGVGGSKLEKFRPYLYVK